MSECNSFDFVEPVDVNLAPPDEMITSSYSGPTGGQCVEVGHNDLYWISDSKYSNGPEKPYVSVSSSTFARFSGLLTAEFARVVD